MLENLHSLIESARAEIAERVDLQALEDIRVRLLGKKGEITALLKSLGAMEPEARKAAGAKINEAKEALTKLLDERRAVLEAEKLAAQLASETVDVTLAGSRSNTRWPASSDSRSPPHRTDLPQRRFHDRRRSGNRRRLA